MSSLSAPANPNRLLVRLLWWGSAVLSWIACILFSSTAKAGKLADRTFELIFGPTLRAIYSSEPYHRYRVHFLAEKAVHLVLFFVLAAILWNLFARFRRRTEWVLMTGCALGFVSEYLQTFSPGRDPAVRDALINASAVILWIVLATLLSKNRPTARAEQVAQLQSGASSARSCRESRIKKS